MLGGDQQFYQKIGFLKKAEVLVYHWEVKLYISWEPESYDQDYTKEVQ